MMNSTVATGIPSVDLRTVPRQPELPGLLPQPCGFEGLLPVEVELGPRNHSASQGAETHEFNLCHHAAARTPTPLAKHRDCLIPVVDQPLDFDLPLIEGNAPTSPAQYLATPAARQLRRD